MKVRILGTGSFLPAKVVTNDDIAKTLDTSDEWIFTHTGIRSRHVAGEGESTATMAAEAAKSALQSAGVKPEEVGLIILASSTTDFNPLPASACIVQKLTGCINAGAMDLQAACSGFVYAMEMGRGFINCNPFKKVLVIGSETLTRIIDWNDRSSCILFGDGAGAVLLGADESDNTPCVTKTILGADGNGSDLIYRAGGTASPTDNPSPKMVLSGHAVFAFAVRTLASAVEGVCNQAGVSVESLDRVFAHQANSRIIEATARRMKLPLEKFYLNLETTANTSAASIPIALDQAVRAGELKDGMKLAMCGFGAGLTYGSMYCAWPYV